MSLELSPTVKARPALVFADEPDASVRTPAWGPYLAMLLHASGLDVISRAESVPTQSTEVIKRSAARPVAQRPGLVICEASAKIAEMGAAAAAELRVPLVIVEPVGSTWTGERTVFDDEDLRPALQRAAAVVSFCPVLPEVPRELAAKGTRMVRLRPAIDTEGLMANWRQRAQIRASLAGRLGPGARPPWLVTLADMTPGTGLESYRLLARALSRLVMLDWSLIIAGTGPCQDEVTRLFTSLPPNRVRVWHTSSPQEWLPLAVAGDLFVWPALDGAGASALLAAQAGGVPVVACDGEQVRDRIEDGITGRVAAAGNAESMANGIGFLLRHRQFLETYAQQAREVVLGRHDLHVVGKALASGLGDLFGTERRTA